VLAGIGVGIYFATKTDNKPDNKVVTPSVKEDAGVGLATNTPDAPTMSRDDIVAISKFGFFSIDASLKSTIYVDNVRLGETPMKRAPLQPGPHKVKLVTKGKKPKEFEITIIGGRDTDEGTHTW
jgi:PEGA domain